MKKTTRKFVKFLTLSCLWVTIVSFAGEMSLNAAEPPRSFEPLVGSQMISEPFLVSLPVNQSPDREAYGVEVASDGRNYLVTWLDEDDGFGKNIGGVIVDETGHVLVLVDESGTVRGGKFNLTFPRYAQGTHEIAQGFQVAWSGGAYLLTWTEVELSTRIVRLLAVRISRYGEIWDFTPIVVPVSQESEFNNWGVALAGNGNDFFVAWTQYNIRVNGARVPGTGAIKGAFIEANGTVSEPILIYQFTKDDVTLVNYSLHSMTSVGGDYFLFVKDVNASPQRGRLVKISGDGSTIDWNYSEVFQENFGNGDIATNGRDLFFTWSDTSGGSSQRKIHGLVMPADSPSSHSGVFTLPNHSGFPTYDASIASNGRDFLAVLKDIGEYDAPDHSNLGVMGVTPEGELLVPGNPVVAENQRIFGDVASNGESYLIAYVSESATSGDYRIEARLIIDNERDMTLSQAEHTGAGGIQFQFEGTPGQSYMIERSEDLFEWSELTSFEDFSGQEAVEDTTSSSTGGAFYRAKKQP